jgi:hypothetical protein
MKGARRFLVAMFVIAAVAGASCAKDPGGTLRVTAPGATAVYFAVDKVNTSGTANPTKFAPPNFEAPLETGTYKPRLLGLEAVKDGATWRITSAGPWGTLATFSVHPKVATEVKLGPPLALRPTVQAAGAVVSIGLKITGQAGETYSPSVTKNGVAVSPPTLTVVGKDGKELASGKFEFG